MNTKIATINRELVSSLILLGIFLFYGLAGLAYPVGRLNEPGPGIFPRTIAAAGCILSVMCIIIAKSKTHIQETSSFSGNAAGLKKGGLFALSLIILLVLTPILGHVISIFLLVTFNSWLLGVKRRFAPVLGFATSAILYIIFVKFLEVGLLKGPFGF